VRRRPADAHAPVDHDDDAGDDHDGADDHHDHHDDADDDDHDADEYDHADHPDGDRDDAERRHRARGAGHGDGAVSDRLLAGRYELGEREIGVSGEVKQQRYPGIKRDFFGKDYVFPMHQIPASYLDQQFGKGVKGMSVTVGGKSVKVPERPGDVRKTHADITKAKDVLGWSPDISMEDGIAELKKEWGIN